MLLVTRIRGCYLIPNYYFFILILNKILKLIHINAHIANIFLYLCAYTCQAFVVCSMSILALLNRYTNLHTSMWNYNTYIDIVKRLLEGLLLILASCSSSGHSGKRQLSISICRKLPSALSSRFIIGLYHLRPVIVGSEGACLSPALTHSWEAREYSEWEEWFVALSLFLSSVCFAFWDPAVRLVVSAWKAAGWRASLFYRSISFFFLSMYLIKKNW